MENMLFHAHSGVRYLVLLAGLIALVMATVGVVRREGGPARAERTSMTAFVGLLDLQLLLGVVLLIVWPFYGALIGHIVMMVAAAAIAHMGSVIARRRAHGSTIRLAAVAAALFVIVGGILAIGRPVV